ncbi:MAG: hypothetical protein J6T32_05660 [Paludibacteraceae bacterium]|nr:hypothetical protein [Paludibacteraceae bacterium]
MKRRIVILALSFLCLAVVAQENRVYLENSQTLSFDENRLPDAQILKGDVRFRHDDALMFCDSAYFFERTNSVTAFGHVRFEQGDTLRGFGDILYYEGDRKLARLCRNVRLEHKNTILTTDSLNYDRITNTAYYFTGGKIQDSLNVLTSRWGEYCPSTNDAIFKYDVFLGNNSFTLNSDRLKYNTATNTAQLIAPTTIVYEGETTIHSSNGWYNTSTEQSMLLDRSVIEHSDGKFLTGDTIYYDKKQGLGQLLYNIETKDTVQKMTLTGHYAELWEKDRRGFVTDSAMLEDWSQPKSTFMHADTLFTEQFPCIDSTCADTIWRQVRAFHHVRMYNDDYQIVADSMTYDGRDSIIVLHHDPILWSDANQVAADSITMYLKNGTLDHIYGVGSAIGIQKETDEYFNQIVGKEMFAYIRNGALDRVDVIGNAETIFYPKDDSVTYVGVNKTRSSHVQVFMQEGKIHHVLFTTETSGTLYPLDQIDRKDTFFPAFFWAESERPASQQDIFLMPEATHRPKTTSISATEDDEEGTMPKQKKQRNKKRK